MLQNQTAVRGRRRSTAAGAGRPSRPGRTPSAPPSLRAPRSRTRGVCRRSCARTSDTSETLIGPPLVLTVTVTGPFNPTGPGDTPSRRAIFTCRPAPRRAGGRLRPHHPVDAGAPRVSRHADRRGRRRADGALPGRAARRQLRLGDRLRAAAHPRRRRSSWCGPSACPPSRPGTVYRVTDARAGLAAVVLPLEQHPRRRTAGARARRAGCRGRRRSSSRCAACWPTRGRRRSSTTSPASGCSCGTCAAPCPTRASSPTSTTSCGRRSAARPSCSSTASCARIAASWIC